MKYRGKANPPTLAASRLAMQFVIAAMLCLIGELANAENTPSNSCGDPFRNHYGPWDIRKAGRYSIEVVEGAHFTPGIESMTRPGTTTTRNMAHDVEYTLNVFPNHHRALITMQRLSERHRADPPPGTERTVECWFDRAVRFTPDDTVVRSLYARYLVKQSRNGEAIKQLETATELGKENPFTQYNIGLVYFEMGEHSRALIQAHRAKALGLNRTELEDQLKKINKWTPPESDGTQ